MKAYSNKMARMGGVLVLAMAFGAMSAARAEAALIAYICDDAACAGGGDLSVTDNGAGDTLGGILGAINFTGSTAGYEIVINTSQSKPVLASGMDLTYTVTDTAGTGAPTGPVWLYATDTDFAGPALLSGTLGGTADNGSVTAIICGGNNNLPRVPVNTAPCSTATDNTPMAIQINLNHNATANPYSLTMGVAVNVLAGTSTGDFRILAAVPEPASLALLSIGLFGVGAAIRRRRQVVA